MADRVLVIDDEVWMRQKMARILDDAGYFCQSALSIADARIALLRQHFDLVICDLPLPGQDGVALVEELDARRPEVAVLVVTGDDDPGIASKVTRQGANGYLVKPFSANELLINVDRALQERRRAASGSIADPAEDSQAAGKVDQMRAELERVVASDELTAASNVELLRRLSDAVGKRDPETAAHIDRIGEYAALLAECAGLGEDSSRRLRLAAPMHDVGKVAVPDSILLKQGPLDNSERALMQQHTVIGYEILAGFESPLLDLAAEIALTHHENVDGSGYPRGLRGESIPISGRVVAIADVFDALISERPYRGALSLEQAVAVMLENRDKQFDPDLLDCFIDNLGTVLTIAQQSAEIDRLLTL